MATPICIPRRRPYPCAPCFLSYHSICERRLGSRACSGKQGSACKRRSRSGSGFERPSTHCGMRRAPSAHWSSSVGSPASTHDAVPRPQPTRLPSSAESRHSDRPASSCHSVLAAPSPRSGCRRPTRVPPASRRCQRCCTGGPLSGIRQQTRSRPMMGGDSFYGRRCSSNGNSASHRHRTSRSSNNEPKWR